MNTTIFQNGMRLGVDFLPIVDNLHWEFQDTISRADALRQLQRKFSTIDSLNQACSSNFSYFEEIPFSYEQLIKYDARLAIEIFAVVGGGSSPKRIVDNSTAADLLILKNRNFENLLRARNRFFPLDISFMKLAGLKESQIVTDLSQSEHQSLLLKENLYCSLASSRTCYETLSSEALYEELKNFKVVVLDSDFFICEDLEFRLKKYIESGGVLVILTAANQQKKALSNYLLKPDLSMNLSSAHLMDMYSIGQGKVVSIISKISGINENVNIIDVISKSTGTTFMKETGSCSNSGFSKDFERILPRFSVNGGKIERSTLKKRALAFIEELSKNSLDRSQSNRLKSAIDSL